MTDNPDDVALQVIRRRAERCESMAALLTEKGTGGHPDHYNPDPIFLDAAGQFTLAAWDLRRAADEILALQVAVACCVDGGSYDIMKDHAAVLLRQLDGHPVKHPQQSTEREAARAALR